MFSPRSASPHTPQECLDRPSLLLTIEEAAEELRMSAGFIKGKIRCGELPVLKLGTRTRIERSALQAFIIKLRTVPDSVPATSGQRQTPEKSAAYQVVEKIAGVHR